MRRFACFLLLLVLGTAPARSATETVGGGPDRLLCDIATRAAEHDTGVPDQLLTAISRVEAGQADPETGRVRSWPWTIDVEGKGHMYASKAEAIAAVEAFQAAGARSIDIGCMQVNLLQHPDAFASLADAFDPTTNAQWAARFLTDLFHQTGSWPHAAAAYHSQTPELGADYQNQVLRMWADGDDPGTAGWSEGGGRHGRRSTDAPRLTDAEGGASGASGVGSPFGTSRAPVVAARYDATPARAGGATGRSLDTYRAMPIALAGRRPPPTRF